MKTLRAGLVLAALALAACRPAPEGVATAAQAADLLIINGRVFTADAAGTTAQALAVRGNTILHVGSNAEVSKLRGRGTRVIDARGGSVIPGLWPPGPSVMVSSFASSNREDPCRTATSNGSTEPTERRCSTAMCSRRSEKCVE